MKKTLLLIILLIWGGIISFSTNISGPRYRLEGAFGFINDKISENYNYYSGAISFLPEWKLQVNDRFDITIGPKITVNTTTIKYTNGLLIISSLILSGEANFNYKVKNNIRIYLGLEAGTGVGFQRYSSIDNSENMKLSENSSDVHYSREFTAISKIALGIKLNDRYNIAIYTGDAKALLGIEVGYTF